MKKHNKNTDSSAKAGEAERHAMASAALVSDRQASLAQIVAEAREQNLTLMDRNDRVQAEIGKLSTLEERNAAREKWGDSVLQSASNVAAAQGDFLNSSDDQVKAAALACKEASAAVKASLENLASIKKTIDNVSQVVAGVGQLLAAL